MAKISKAHREWREAMQCSTACGDGYQAVIAKDIADNRGTGPAPGSEHGTNFGFGDYQDTDDQDEAEKRMKKARPELNTRQAIQLAIGSYRHRKEVAEKTLKQFYE